MNSEYVFTTAIADVKRYVTEYFSHRLRPPEARLTMNGPNIPFVDHVKYFGVIFDKRIIWRLNIEMAEAKVFRTFIRIYFL
jgi:hypothetical protein